MQSEPINVIHDLKLDMMASPVDDVTIINRTQLESLEAALSTDAGPVGDPLELPYKNWRGEISTRKIHPIRLEFGATEWHPEPQWLLVATDIEKNAERSFALKDFNPKQPAPAVAVKAELTPESYVYDFIENGERSILPLPAWEKPYQDADIIAAAERAGYIWIGRNVGCDITVTAHGRTAAELHKTRSALSAQVQDVAEYERREQVCRDTALSQWERSLKRPDLTEKDRVIGAVEAYKRQAFAFTMLTAAPAAKQGEAE